MADYIKIGIIALLLIILFIGIKKSMKVKKLGYFLVSILVDIIIVCGLIYLKNNYQGDETTMKETSTSTSTTTTKKSTTTTKKVDTTSKGFVIEKKDGVTYIDGHLIANKTYPLPSSYVPKDTHTDAGTQKYCQTCIVNDAWDAWTLMKADATALGLNIWIQSGYRSYSAQKGLYDKYVNRDGKDAADTYSARPGHSEHQSGYAFDLNSITDAFASTTEGKWVNDNAYKYGFIIRYPKGKEDITGYKYESWHLRYVGKDLASKLYNNGDWITMEEYFGIDSQYKD